MNPTRDRLMSDVARALRHCFPDRAEEMLYALDQQWCREMKEAEMEAHAENLARESQERLFAEVFGISGATPGYGSYQHYEDRRREFAETTLHAVLNPPQMPRPGEVLRIEAENQSGTMIGVPVVEYVQTARDRGAYRTKRLRKRT